MIALPFLAATLSVLLCPQAAPDGVVRGCVLWGASSLYPDHATCQAVAERRYADG